MKILLLTHGSYLRRDLVVSGNSVRAYFLAHALVQNGIEVTQVYPKGLAAPGTAPVETPAPGITVRTYQDRDDLSRVIHQEAPDVLVAGYWELMEELPSKLSVPIVLDVVAPRVLEVMYQEDRDLNQEILRMLRVYRRADRFLVGNQRQGRFLLPWLIMAGFDCSREIPIDVVPISAGAGSPRPPTAVKKNWRFVSGGVSWPWRRIENYFDVLVHTLRDTPGLEGRLILFSGNYVYAADVDDPAAVEKSQRWPGDLVQYKPLQPYGQMEKFLLERCDIGLELANWNVEREYSQSFRTIEFLRCGLPVICNDYLELARHIETHDAGWVLGSPEDLPELLREITASPSTWARKSENAISLVEADFNYLKNIRPLADFIREPRRPRRVQSPIYGTYVESGTDAMGADQLLRQRNDLAARLEAQSHQLEQIRQQAERLSSVLNGIQTSRSWRFTAPFRAFSNWLRHRLHTPSHENRRSLRTSAGRTARALASVFRYTVGLLSHRSVKKSVLMVNRDDIYPVDHGAAVRIDQVAIGLSRVVKAVYLVTDSRERYYVFCAGARCEARFPRWLKAIGPDRCRVRNHLEQKVGIPSRESFLYFPVSDWSYILRTAYVALRHPTGLFLAEGYPAFAKACLWGRRLFGGQVFMVEHNVEYKRIREQYEIADHTLEFLRLLELRMCNESDAVIAVSERDRQQLLLDGVDEHRLQMIPHGVALDDFDRSTPLDLREMYQIAAGTPILVYHGIYIYPPNLEAMQVMAREILPRLNARGFHPKVLAVGRNTADTSLHDDIIFTGSVERVEPYLLAADLAVVPLLRGGGTRMKILDYFAAGLPVVSTAKGIEGVSVENGVHAIIEDDLDRFAESIMILLKDRSRAQEMGRRGRAFVEALDWKAMVSRYAELMRCKTRS